MERAIGGYHPVVSFSYFGVIITASMLFMHPVFVVISLISGIIYSLVLNKDKTLKVLSFGLIMAIGIALANVIFVHRGMTVLFYLRGNPITLESFIYGLVSGAMMLSVILWFSCYNEIITSDKFLYVFGKIMPSVALIVCMTLRLIPKLMGQIKVIANSQKTIGLDYSEGTIMMRAKSSMRILSILVTWALEDAVQTADSMKARGYGLKGRKSFSIYTFITRDAILLFVMGIMTMLLVMAYAFGYGKLMFYPYIAPIKTDILSIIIYVSFAGIALLPVVLEIVEELRWKYLK